MRQSKFYISTVRATGTSFVLIVFFLVLLFSGMGRAETMTIDRWDYFKNGSSKAVPFAWTNWEEIGGIKFSKRREFLHNNYEIVFENVESNSRFYEILIQNSNSSLEVRRSSSRATKGDLIAQRSDLPINTVFTGVLEMHDGTQATGQLIKAGQICLLEELLTDANGNLWARIKFRE